MRLIKDSRIGKRMVRDRQGVAMIEFAFAFPIFLILTLGVIDISRLLLLEQRIALTARTMADLVAQQDTLNEADLASLYSAVEFVAKPFDMSTDGTVILTSVAAPSGALPAEIQWQRVGAGTLSATSTLGQPGSPAILPQGFVFDPAFTLIVSEVFYDYSPLFFATIFPPRRIEENAWFRARRAALLTVAPAPPPSP